MFYKPTIQTLSIIGQGVVQGDGGNALGSVIPHQLVDVVGEQAKLLSANQVLLSFVFAEVPPRIFERAITFRDVETRKNGNFGVTEFQ